MKNKKQPTKKKNTYLIIPTLHPQLLPLLPFGEVVRVHSLL